MPEKLKHYGVKGMHWGIRRSRVELSNKIRVNMNNKKIRKLSNKRRKILNSPRKLSKNLDKFTEEEINKAMKKMNMQANLRTISQNKVSHGQKMAATFLKYGTTAAAAYSLYNSDAGKVARSGVNSILKIKQ